jgi:uncharacterized protein YraI
MKLAYSFNLRRRAVAAVVTGLALTIVSVPIGVMSAPAAGALTGYKVVASPSLNARSGPSTGYGIVGSLSYGAPIDISCQQQGGTNVGGNATWDRLSNGWWISDYWTNTPSFNSYIPGVTACTTAPPPASVGVGEQAARWAQARAGQVYTNENPNASWWSGWCETFAWLAYGRHFTGFPSAIANYYAWRNAGYIHGGVPPRGALVFYNYAPYGHVAVAIGNGQVVSTMGYSYQRLAVAQHAYNYFSYYLGWAMPFG